MLAVLGCRVSGLGTADSCGAFSVHPSARPSLPSSRPPASLLRFTPPSHSHAHTHSHIHTLTQTLTHENTHTHTHARLHKSVYSMYSIENFFFHPSLSFSRIHTLTHAHRRGCTSPCTACGRTGTSRTGSYGPRTRWRRSRRQHPGLGQLARTR